MPGRFGKKLQYLRDQAALSQSDLARQLGDLSQSHLSYLEAGRKAPSLGVVVQLAEYFSVSVDYLLRDEVPIALAAPGYSPAKSDRTRRLRHLGPHVHNIRQARGISQQELAQRLTSASRPFISLVENGRKTPSPEIALQLADLLGVSLDELLADPEDPGQI